MARLFIGPKEIALVNDWSKEYIKDIVGQTIIYYPLSTMKTKVHPVYDEAVNKIFENPIKLSIIASQPQWETKHNRFGMEQTTSIEFFVQSRDLLDKGLTLAEGDFFTYGDAVFEVVSYLQINNIFGQEEYQVGYKLTGRLARPGQFDPKSFFAPQKDEADKYTETPVQKVFEQQRGFKENSEGATGDIRQVRDRLGDQMEQIALGEGPRKIELDEDEKTSSFVSDPLPPKKGIYDD